MESLRAMFPETPDSTLSHALATSNGDVSAAVEQLLPASEQVAQDAALARALQLADAGGDPTYLPSATTPTATTPTATSRDAGTGLADVAKPVLDGLAAAGAAAKAAVEYVANEFASVTAGPSSASPRTSARRADDDTAVVAGGYNSRAESGGMHMRANRGSGRASPRTGFKKDD